MEETGHSNWYRYLLLYTLPFSERPPLVPVLGNQKKFEEGFCSYKTRQKSKWERKEMRGKTGVEDCVCVLCHSVMSDSLGPPWTVAHQAPLSMGILQARLLKWVVMPSSRGSSQPRNRYQIFCIASGFFTVWTTSPWILEWVAYPFSKGSSQLRDQTRDSCVAAGFFTTWATSEAPEQ